MKIAICDDDKIIVELLNKYIIEFFDKMNSRDYDIHEYSSGDKLLEDSEENDLIFLDIEMPGLDGICVGQKLKAQNSNSIIIVVTSFSEYLDDAMRISVFRYLSKPIDKQRLFRNLKDAMEAYSRRSIPLLIETSKQLKKIDSDDIVMLEARGRKLVLVTVNSEYELSGSIKDWSNKLSIPNFYICHRSYIVNISKISSITNDTVYLLGGKYQAYLAKRKHAEIKRKFMLYIENKR